MLSVQSWRWHVRLAGMTNFLLGALVSAWPELQVFPPIGGALERYFVVTGTLASLCGAGCALLPRHNMLLSVGTLVLGFCVLLSPIPFEFEMTWTMVLAAISVGLVLMMLSWWSISETLQVRGSLHW
jgi:hypothetical protein